MGVEVVQEKALRWTRWNYVKERSTLMRYMREVGVEVEKGVNYEEGKEETMGNVV